MAIAVIALAACQPSQPSSVPDMLVDSRPVQAVPTPAVVARVDRNLGDLLAAITESAAHGLNPADYQPERLRALAGTAAGTLLTREMALRLARDLAHGRVSAGRVDSAWHIRDSDPDPTSAVDAALHAQTLAMTLAGLAPAAAEYQLLTTEMRSLGAGNAIVSADPARQRRLESLRATLERWRWLPRTLPAHRLWVNLPEYRLFLWRGGAAVRAHDVIIGKVAHPTPSFRVDVTGVVFNPWWDPPRRLVSESVIPALRRGQGARLDYRLYRDGLPVPLTTLGWKSLSSLPSGYRLRQAPGPSNALGQVKLRMYNTYDIYLHDTPNKELFDQPKRALSNGCIRTRDALDLARALVAGTAGWDAARVATALETRRETTVGLGQPLPAFLVYMTAVVRDGAVITLDDVYGRDAGVVAALDTPRDARADLDVPVAATAATGAADDDGASRCAV